MIESYRRLKKQRALGEVEESGFTLIELLIVIVVLGILAAIVVFALGGVTGQSVQSACNSDAKTVNLAIGAYQAQNSLNLTDQVNQNVLTADQVGPPATTHTLQSWPVNSANHYAIYIFGSTTPASATQTTVNGLTALTTGDASTPAVNDVIVVTKPGTVGVKYWDATQNPASSCTAA